MVYPQRALGGLEIVSLGLQAVCKRPPVSRANLPSQVYPQCAFCRRWIVRLLTVNKRHIPQSVTAVWSYPRVLMLGGGLSGYCCHDVSTRHHETESSHAVCLHTNQCTATFCGARR